MAIPIRRKVLALLCFLVTRPNMAAARDQVVDALWPDQDPTAASNSLNQTVYFLRRVFEPNYVDDSSPGYLRHETDLLWLDQDLVTARIRGMSKVDRRGPNLVLLVNGGLLSRSYKGRFALDFEYEEWSGSYRDNLHASYLRSSNAPSMTRQALLGLIGLSTFAGEPWTVDPSCEPIERQLLRLYQSPPEPTQRPRSSTGTTRTRCRTTWG